MAGNRRANAMGAYTALLEIQVPGIRGSNPQIEVAHTYRRWRPISPMLWAARSMHQARGHIAQIRAPNPMWEFLTGPIDFLLHYIDENAIWANSPSVEAWRLLE